MDYKIHIKEQKEQDTHEYTHKFVAIVKACEDMESTCNYPWMLS